MRKRISVFTILFVLTLLLTALAPFAQSQSETMDLTSETAVSEAFAGTEPASAANDESDSEAEQKSDDLDVPKITGTEEYKCEAPDGSCGTENLGSEEEEQQPDLNEPVSEEKKDSKADSQPEKDKKQTGNRLLGEQSVSWHMNFNVDCVSSGCIALSDRSAGMYVSACNDGGGDYNSVTYSPVNHTGKFVSYFVTSGRTPTLGSSNSTPIQNPSSSFSYGPVPVNTCVTAVFESEFDNPPADYTQYKRFEFKLTADNGIQVQSTNAYADKYGCYAPTGETGVSATVKPNSSCVKRNAEKAVYEIRIDNTGSTDICKTTVSADRPGTFHLKNSTASSAPFVYNQTIYTEDYITVIFEEDLSNASLSAGSSHRVNFTVSSNSCASNGGSAHATAFGQIEICSEPTPTPTKVPTKTPTRTPAPTFTPTVTQTPLPSFTPTVTRTPVTPTSTFTPTATKTSVPTATKTSIPTSTPTMTPTPNPSIDLSIEMPSDCSDPDTEELDEFTVIVENTGDTDFCKVEVEGPTGSVVISANSSYTSTGNKAVLSELKKGQTVRIIFDYKPESLTGESYSVNFTAIGFTDQNGRCVEAIQTESTADMDICDKTPDLDLDFTIPSQCSDPQSDTPDEFPITVTNSGNTDFCKIVITGPSGAVFKYNGITTDGNILTINGLQSGQSALVTAFYKGRANGRFYPVSFSAEGYIQNGNVCSEEPAAGAGQETLVLVCVEEPAINADINTAGECHVYSGDPVPDRFDYVISNPGSAAYCNVSVKFDVIVNGKVVRSETIDVNPQSIPVGGSLQGVYEVIPEDIPEILPGGTYAVQITASASTFSESSGCPAQPAVTDSDIAEKPVCPDVKPVITAANLNPACIDAGDTLKFRGMIDIDSHSAARKITVTTGKISWGGTSDDCEITSVKKSANTEFADIPAEQRGTSYEFENFGHGAGAIGFICEAKTAENEQKRNGQTLSFSASATVNSASNIPSYQIESNTVTGSQQCVYTHTTQLPYTGDDTNMPVLIGLFSMFIICGGASSFVLLRKKRTGTEQKKSEE